MSRMDKKTKNTKNTESLYEGAEKKSFKQRIKDMKTWQKIVALLAIIVLLAGIIVGVVVYNYFNGIVDEMHEPTPEDYDLSLVDVDGYINILLLGVDTRDMKDIKGTRSDMIMIASINKETNEVKLTSIYRDTYLKLGDTSTYDKITHACSYGGPEMVMKSLNQALDLNITNYAIVNFKAVADLVDAVGGITVDVQPGEIKQLNKYTKATAKNIGREDYNLVSEAGVQTIEGVQAVSYGRIRKGVGDDFKRTERMRIVVSKVFEKAKTMTFSELKGIIDVMVPQVKTNLKMNDILALAIRLPQYSISSGSGWPYKWSSGYINNVSYVFPGGGLVANTVMLHQEVFGQTDYSPSATVSNISGEIAARLQAARDKAEISGEQEGESKNDDNLNPDGENPDATDPNNPTDPTDPTDPGTTDPTVPGTTDPTNPGTTDPTNPGTTDPTNPGTTDPTNPGTTDPTNPGTTDPTNPGTTDPTNPGTTDPTNPGTTDPNTRTDPTVPIDPPNEEAPTASVS